MNNYFDAFISYGRTDSKAFATKLHARLVEQGLNTWFDQQDIPLGVDFQNQINDGIEKAHNFLFIIAPHSVNSPYCHKEIEIAIKCNKRIIPLLHVMQISQETWQQRNPNGTTQDWEAYKAKGLHESYQNMHPIIRKLNWVYFQEGINDFEKSLKDLIDVIQRHGDYVGQHTQFFVKALEWERHQKQTSYLLIGEEKQLAQSWLKKRFKDEQPPCLPSELHCEYITESIKNANNLMTQVFLSYVESDRATMEKIRNSLRRESITVWTNKTDIQTGEAFEEAVKRGIEQADNVVYLLSPDSITSDDCQRELEYAQSLHKRIIPLRVRETDSMLMPPALRYSQHIDLTDNFQEQDYRLDESQLLKILRQDAPYYNEHKVLLVKALKWKKQHCNPSILLRGYNLRHAQAWLKVAKHRTQHPPTPLQKEFITESLRQPPAESLDVFVSYSRADSDFARNLNDALQLQGKTTWFDQESIASGTDFQQEIYGGIKACDNFLFILSPRSVLSPYCGDEVEYAAQLNKRFVTVLHGEVHPLDLHPELAKVQWIDFNQNERDFNANFNQLVRTLDTDREHLRSHTKWLQRAIEWKDKDKSADLLLRGNEFAIAENWFKEAQQNNKQPAPTPLQKAFIEASKNAIVAAQEEEKRRQAQMLRLQEERTKEAEARLAAQKKSARLQKFFLFRVSMALLVVSGLAVGNFFQYQKAVKSEIQAISASSEALLSSNQEFDALIASLKASIKLNSVQGHLAFVHRLEEKADIQKQISSLLEEAVYKVKERNRLERHKAEVVGVSFSTDGQMLATASADETVKLWSLDGKELSTLKGHTALVRSVSFSPDRKTIATASWDGTVKLWTRDGKEIKTLNGHKEAVYDVSFSPDRRTLATASWDKTVKLWTSDGKLIKTLQGHKDGVLGVSFSPDSKTIASASADKTVILWSLEGEKLQILTGHKDWVWSVAWSPNGQTLATAGKEGIVKLWSKDSKEINTLDGHNDSVTSVSFSPDGKTIASASSDKTVILWSLDGEKLQTITGHKDCVWSVVWSPDGQTLATASKDKTVKLWRVKGKELQILPVHNSAIYSISFSPDGRTIATASWDKTAKLLTREGNEIAILQGHTEPIYCVSFSPDGKTIATASWDGTVKLWSGDGKEFRTLTGHKNKVWSLSFSPDGKTLASASEDKTVVLWSLDGKQIQTLNGHRDIVNSVSFSPDGKTIATASEDGTVKLWTSEGKPFATLNGHTEGVHNVTFSFDGKMIATASEDGTVKLWTSEGKLIKTLQGHEAGVSKVSFSPDERTIATASLDHTVKLWSRDGKELKTYKGHDEQVYGLSFSPDGKTLASSDNAGRLILWKLDLEPDDLLKYGCDWVQDYLKTNPNVSESDSLRDSFASRTLCDGIATQK